MRYVLLLVNEEAHIRELSRVVDLLLAKSSLRPVVFIEDRLKHLGVPALFADRGIEVLTSDALEGGDGRAALGPQGAMWRRALASMVVGGLRALSIACGGRIGRLNNIIYYAKLHRDLMLRRAAVCEAALSQRHYVAFVLCEDNIELDTAVWIAVARRLGVRSVIVPYTISNVVEFAESYVRHPPHQAAANLGNLVCSILFSNWVLHYKGHRILRAPHGKILAFELLGLTPPMPWLLNSGYADAIAVESEAMLEYYRAAGIPDVQLAATGSLSDDVMAEVLAELAVHRRSMFGELHLAQDKPLLLCALPPDQNTYNRPGCEFADFDDLTGFLGDCLSQVPAWNVLVRPHPKTAPDRLDSLRRRGVKITYADTATLVPLCDVYVASVSATIRWAIACGKPVINYDVYRYGYADYAGVEGVVLVNERKEFRDVLESVTTDGNYRRNLAAAQHRAAAHWGRFDGTAGDNLIRLMSDGAGASKAHQQNAPAVVARIGEDSASSHEKGAGVQVSRPPAEMRWR